MWYVAGGMGVAVLVSMAKMLRDVQACRAATQGRARQPWEVEPPPKEDD